MSFQASLKVYLKELEKNLAFGNYTEHTHRFALKKFLESIYSDVNVINEPKRIECGSPDYILLKGNVPLGYIETKDIGTSLIQVEKSEQIKRYLSLPNLILTDYLEFRWYVNGQLREPIVKIASLDQENNLIINKNEFEKFHDLLNSYYSIDIPTIKNSYELAERMASLSRLLKVLIIKTFEKEENIGNLHSQFESLKEILIPDLTLEQFADMYAQTIPYGLFSSRCNLPDEPDFSREKALSSFPKTNPFLRKLFIEIAGYELDERIAWIVDEATKLLAKTDINAILNEMAKQKGKEDPIVNFYETYLSVYNPETKVKRGVFYTPLSVVSFITSSIDKILLKSFNKSRGLADSETLVLDPACGTGTFLFKVIDTIYTYFSEQQGLWNAYVTEKLLSRIFGFELLMTPYSIAHLKLSLQLQDLGYSFSGDERLGVYLTNSLEEGVKKTEKLFAGWISEEANIAAQIKKEKPIMVVLGNPPYSKISANRGNWILNLISDYREVDGKPLKEKKLWIQDDYVKFIRFGQWRIEQTREGILAFITNHGYLNNPTFRGMRQSLMNTFDSIFILNLHGNALKKETTPDGGLDENVFDIRQGVAISIFIKNPRIKKKTISYKDVWGSQNSKYSFLENNDVYTILKNNDWEIIEPQSPYYFFVPKDFAFKKEYERGWSIPEIFPESNVGFVTARDSFVIARDLTRLRERIKCFKNDEEKAKEVIQKYSLHDTSSWNVSGAIRDLQEDVNWEDDFRLCLYRPFDYRHIFYSKHILERPVFQIQRHMLRSNLAFLTHRPHSPTFEFSYVFCSDSIADQCSAGNKTTGAGSTYLFPLYIYSNDYSSKKPNINRDFIKDVETRLKLKFVDKDKGNLSTTIGVKDLFYYIYALLHCPTYRQRYSEFLKIEYPRIQITEDLTLFHSLVQMGEELVSLHLLKSPVLSQFITSFPRSGTNRVQGKYPRYEEENERVYINKDQYFGKVEREIWNFQVGGYQVCYKWLKDRRKFELTYDEIELYQKIIVATSRTIEIMKEIDELIDKYPLSKREKFSSQTTI